MESTDTTQRTGQDGINLIYTLAFDPVGHGGTRQMVKMLGGSVARTYFTGDMVIYRNSQQPVFLVQRAGIDEVFVVTPELENQALADYAGAWKARAREVIEAERYDWVMFLDADCLVLRNIDHLLTDRDCDILFQPEHGRSKAESDFNGYQTDEEMEALRASSSKLQAPNTQASEAPHSPVSTLHSPLSPARTAINSGTWAVRGKCYAQVMEEWARIQAAEPVRETKSRAQSAWNRLMLDAAQHGWRAEPFEAHEVQFPFHLDKDWMRYKDAAIVHCAGGTLLEKIEFMFGLYMQKFFFDPGCTLLTIVEM